ncbi:DUF1232 domain-containing protein [Ensifer adhaerens]|uniref:YkvA family protein n=1 Tax=Ensifer adhaerens TaxID=106592 RepID=UPI001CBD7A30|nr:YkvA family protein [Ensifer adhaerens]MBZ7920760.1 DUF1232 domain-containing protein [Ensifer adhaerens]UAX93219.1 DUF1232 domain-containing protein [Ensifer adhaerens]UAY00856.1 DUF1232 domain-containing protein [Ensifer adhaerens]UAY08237.1 DUF1232 domain-containing protein [Ensifer adhaerens]
MTSPGRLQRAKQWARQIKRDVVALWFAARDPRTPISAKFVAGAVAAYALSPVDLIPDFIPILGYLDDLILVPLGILLAVRLVPPALMDEFRQRATAQEGRPSSRGGFVAILSIWFVVAAVAAWVAWGYLSAKQ